MCVFVKRLSEYSIWLQILYLYILMCQVNITSKLMLLCWIFQNFTIFDFFYILQNSVATYLRCGEERGQKYYFKFIAESKSEIIVKIEQHLAKLWTNNIVGSFLTHSVQCRVSALNQFFVVRPKLLNIFNSFGTPVLVDLDLIKDLLENSQIPVQQKLLKKNSNFWLRHYNSASC